MVGSLDFTVFALGIIGTGLLAVPVLAGSAAYAVSNTLGWKASLSHDFHEARGFYGLIIAATALGTLLSLFEVDPIQALVWSAVAVRTRKLLLLGRPCSSLPKPPAPPRNSSTVAQALGATSLYTVVRTPSRVGSVHTVLGEDGDADAVAGSACCAWANAAGAATRPTPRTMPVTTTAAPAHRRVARRGMDMRMVCSCCIA